MPMTRQISRRTMLRGVGVGLLLPWLEAMTPLAAWGKQSSDAGPPTRMAFVYVPNGKNMADWTPEKEGAGFDLPAILQPLAAHQDKLLALTGLTADKARANGDGGGDHARAMAAFLTGAQPRKTDGANIRAGVSVDQVAAAQIGHLTRLSSLELGCESGAMAGNCDSGYSCAYASTMSWRSSTQPLPKEINPKLVFERLFGSGSDAQRVERSARRKSILDFVRDDSKSLARRLGSRDVDKLDEYFSSVRDIEQRMARAETLPSVVVPDVEAPEGPPEEYEEHIRLMGDMLVLAFQADVTRVATFVVANEGSNRPYPFVDVPEGHHDLSHHGNDEAKKAKISDINTFHTRQFAYLLEKMDSVSEGDGTLLDNSMVVYGSGNSDGNRHNHDDLPILLAGGGGGSLETGRHVRYPDETPLNDLWLAMLDRMGVDAAKLGDSSGVLAGLS